jgi:hypothetical protein
MLKVMMQTADSHVVHLLIDNLAENLYEFRYSSKMC